MTMPERDDDLGRRLAGALDGDARGHRLPADFTASVTAALPEPTPARRFLSFQLVAVAATLILAVTATTLALTVWRLATPPPGSSGSPSASATPIATATATPAATPTASSATPPTTRAEATLGDWQLVLSVDDAELPAGDAIVVHATLAYLGSLTNTVAWGPGSGLVSFELQQTDGTAQLVSGGNLACARYDFHQGSALSMPFMKPTESSSRLPTWAGPSYRDDPGFRLPEGRWDLTATAWFSPGGSDCGNDIRTMTATLHLVTTSAATPSITFETAPLVLRLDRLGELGDIIPDIFTTVTADGRMTWTAANGDLVERGLTDAGLAMVRNALDDTHLLGTNATFGRTPLPGVEPPGRGAGGWTFHTITASGDPVTVSTTVIDSDESLYWVTSQERLTLDALRTKLVDPEEWLPADAWADSAARLYQPPAWAVVLDIESTFGDTPIGSEFADFGWPIPEPSAFGVSANDPTVQKSGTLRCGYLTGTTMVPIIEKLSTYQSRTGSQDSWQFWAQFASGSDEQINVFLVKVLPDGSPGCGEVHG